MMVFLSFLIVSLFLSPGFGFKFEKEEDLRGWRILRRKGRSIEGASDRMRFLEEGVVVVEGAQGYLTALSSPRLSFKQGVWRMRWRWRSDGMRYGANIILRLDKKTFTGDGMRISGTDDWRWGEMIFEIKEKTEAGVIFHIRGSGRLYIDEICFERLKKPPQQRLPDALFVNLSSDALEVFCSLSIMRIQPSTQIKSKRRGEITVHLGRGGRCGILVAFRSKKSIDSACIKVRIEDEAPFSLHLYKVLSVSVGFPSVPLGYYEPSQLPEISEEAETIDIKASKTETVLLWFRTDEEAKSGRYRLVFDLYKGKERLVSFPITVFIHDVDIASNRPRVYPKVRLKYLCRWLGISQDEAVELVRREFKRWDVEPVSLAVLARRSRWIKADEDGVKMDWDYFDRVVEEHIRAGFKTVHLMPDDFRARRPYYRMRPFLKAEYGSEEFWKLLSDYLRKMSEHIREKGFRAQFFFYPWDEPSRQEYKEFKKLVGFFKRHAPNIEVWCAAGGVPNEDLSGTVDRWFLNMRKHNTIFYTNAIKKERSSGVSMGCYANDRYNLALPLLHMRLLGLIMAYQGFDSILWWNVCGWHEDMFKEPILECHPSPSRFNDAGQGYLFYPNQQKKSLNPSLRWLVMLEAMDDYALWRNLALAIGRTAERLDRNDLKEEPLKHYFHTMLSGSLAGQFRNDAYTYQLLRAEAFRRIDSFKRRPLALTRIFKTEEGFLLVVAAENGCEVMLDGKPLEGENGIFKVPVECGSHTIRITKDGLSKEIKRLVKEWF